MDEYEDLMQEFLKLKQEIKTLEQEQSLVKGKLQTLMERDGVDNYDGATADASIITRTNTSVDKKKASLLFGESFNECIRTSESKFIMVKEK